MKHLYLLLPAGMLLATVCSAQEPAATPAPLPPIACEFETVTARENGTAEAKTRAWRLWRAADAVETQELDSPDAEAWHRDPRGQVTYFRVFHPEKRAIEYKATDLSISHSTPNWERLASVVAPEFIAKNLKQTGEERVLERAAIRYEGESGGSKFEVVWLTAEQIPAFVRETRDGDVSTIRLRAIHPLPESPWPHGLKDAYEIIDFADLGDKESDPTLQAMLKRSGHAGHRH